MTDFREKIYQLIHKSITGKASHQISLHHHKCINRDKLCQHPDQRVDQYQPNTLVQFGMGENVGQKLICRTCSINPKKW